MATKAQLEGAKVFEADLGDYLSNEENPYPVGSTEHVEWATGWEAAMEEDMHKRMAEDNYA